MSPLKIALVCVPVALAGVGLATLATARIGRLERELAAEATAGEAAGASFVQTLRGEHAERQRLSFERRRAQALDLAAARRDRLLGLGGVAAAGLAAAALRVLARIAAEVEEDRAHVDAQPERGPDRS
jgi:hypothetical protein